ncbi:MAG TPA: RNA 2',3'-cyclic phosphodiesterase [Candidatus Eisenbacteria bacterium]|jgi:2'-5' RNA ligase
MRLFLAVFPPAEVQSVAAQVIERLRRPHDLVSWVKRENLHFTLRFLGELGESGAGRAAEAAIGAAADHRAFEVALGVPGAFPSAKRARVLWLGLVHGAEPLVALARSVEQALVRRGFDRADRSFTAHLTLGRVRDREQDWSERLTGPAPEPTARFIVERVVVVESTLSPKGSIYRVRAEAPLAPDPET